MQSPVDPRSITLVEITTLLLSHCLNKFIKNLRGNYAVTNTQTYYMKKQLFSLFIREGSHTLKRLAKSSCHSGS